MPIFQTEITRATTVIHIIRKESERLCAQIIRVTLQRLSGILRHKCTQDTGLAKRQKTGQ